jgi:hypothetical protein
MTTPTEQQRKRQERATRKFWVRYYLEVFGTYGLAAAVILWNWW